MTTAQVTKVAIGDVPVNRRRGGELRVLLSPTTAGATTGFLGVLRLAPGERLAEHYHPYSEEFLYAVQGEVVVRVDGQPTEVGPEEALLIPRNARHRVENHGDTTATVVFQLCPLAPRPELGHVDTEPPAPDAQRVTGDE